MEALRVRVGIPVSSQRVGLVGVAHPPAGPITVSVQCFLWVETAWAETAGTGGIPVLRAPRRPQCLQQAPSFLRRPQAYSIPRLPWVREAPPVALRTAAAVVVGAARERGRVWSTSTMDRRQLQEAHPETGATEARVTRPVLGPMVQRGLRAAPAQGAVAGAVRAAAVAVARGPRPAALVGLVRLAEMAMTAN